jgi:hypothetical protein
MTSMKSLDLGDRDCLSLNLKQDEAIVARVILEAALCHETNHYKSILVSLLLPWGHVVLAIYCEIFKLQGVV